MLEQATSPTTPSAGLRRRRAPAVLVTLSVVAVFAFWRIAFGLTVTVTTTSDVADGDTSSITNLISSPGADGAISLREAITASNNTTGEPHTIGFAIAGCGGVCTIATATALPALTRSVVLDGWSQPGWTSAPVVALDGAGGTAANGLTINSGTVTVRGLSITSFAADGIEINGGTGHTVQGNYIGLRPNGVTVAGNGGDGVAIDGGSGTTVGGSDASHRNVLSGNGVNGVELANGTTAATIRGNYIGTTADGTAARGNGKDGVRFDDNDGSNSVVDANLISGNAEDGITVRPGANNITITGNSIGTNAAGTAALPNMRNGIELAADAAVIGGSGVAARNLISGNDDDGITIGSGASSVSVLGNYIGVNAAGTAAIANGDDGIHIGSTGSGINIGGVNAGEGNVISGNASDGIEVETSTAGVTIRGNRIGTNAAGSAAVPNGDDGIDADGGTGHVIGGTAAGAANQIAFNTERGVRVDGGSGLAILGNSIHSNGTIGIDLISTGQPVNGVTANDGAKTGGQPNLLMDTPVITSAEIAGSVVSVAGYVGSAAGQSTFASSRVEVFIADTTAAGNGQGRTYLGYLSTDASGNFRGTLTGVSGITPGTTRITGTATDSSNNTSEFGPNFVVRTAIGIWPLNETAGTTANDSAGGNNGAYLNGVLLNRGAVGTCSTGSVQFDGINDHVVIPHVPSYLLNAGSAAFWLKVDSLPGSRRGLFSKDSTGFDTGGHLTLWLNSNGTIHVRQQSTTDSYEYDTTAAIQVGQWNHIAYTWGGGSMRLYVNGGTPATNAYTGGWGSNSGGIGNQQPIVLGANSWAADDLVANNLTDYFAGYMSDVRLIDRALTGADIDTVRSCGPSLTLGLSGTVFEDVNYGGGNGRNRATAVTGGGSARSGARVELYDSTGNFVSATTTDANGAYTFADASGGATYTVRVVNETVTSARSGYTSSLRAVQTFRTEAPAGTATDVYDHVGGAVPSVVDAGSNTINATLASLTTASTTPQSVSTVVLSNGPVANVDFGFNFNTVVNVSGSGQGSLRQAITNANTLAGDASLAVSGRGAGAEHIVFMISNGTTGNGGSLALAGGLRPAIDLFTGGAAVIAPTTALPTLSTSMVIDAQTQPGWTAAPAIVLDGVSATADGFSASAGTSTIRGFSVIRFTGAGLQLSGGSAHVVQGNYIGLRPDGTTAAGNGSDGVRVTNIADVVVGGLTASQRNVIVASGDNGIEVLSGGSRVNVIGNYIGTTADGSAARGNTNDGVRFDDGDGSNSIVNANLISGNGDVGITVRPGANNITITGNRIGTNAAGTAAVSNGNYGIELRASSAVIGGSDVAQRNLISGNGDDGILIASSASSVSVLGNYIGVNAAGTAAIANAGDGIDVSSATGSINIGGVNAGEGNVISGNADDGIDIGNSAVGVTIRGNRIGTNAAGSAAVPNGDDGIDAKGGTGHTIGGTAAGAANQIAMNTDRGIMISGSSSLAILGNAIHGNGAIGIDLTSTGQPANGVTVNDGVKTTGQPNLLMDHPVITSAVAAGSVLVVNGYVGSAAGQATFAGSRVEFFISDQDGSGYGEGRTYLGFVTTDASGNFSGTLTGVTGVTAGTSRITATATDTANNTSEFGPNVIAVGPSISGTVFEDVTYGGGAGRDRATALAAGGSGRSGARVELYEASGNFAAATTTDGSGNYVFANLTGTSYTVRAVNGSVNSARAGYVAGLLPVQTFGTDAGGGIAVANGNRVGGQAPSLADAGNGSTTLAALTTGSTTALSITAVTPSLGNVIGVDFGFSFSTIVNSNDTGQGSLRQFITNANALANPNLAGQTAGLDASIFMIPSATDPFGRPADPNFASGRAVITLASALPQISGNNTSIDGSTQTTHVGNTNAGTLGAGGTVGVDALTLATVQRPEIEVRGSGSQPAVGIDTAAVGLIVRGLAIYGFSGTATTQGAIVLQSGAANALIEGNVLGTTALAFTDPGAGVRGGGNNLTIVGADNGIARNNLVGYAGRNGISGRNGVTGWLLEGNEVRGHGITSSATDGINMEEAGSQGNTIRGNLIADNRGPGIDTSTATGTATVENNTVTGNGFGSGGGGSETWGIAIHGSGSVIDRNIVSGNFGDGVIVVAAAEGNRITMNRIFGNGGLGIDLGDDGVTLNDGAKTAGQANQHMDAPVVTQVTYAATVSNLRVRGYVGSAANQTLFANTRVEIFASDNDASGYGEGQVYLGFTTTDANGNFDVQFSTNAVAVSQRVTATATDGSNNTSEFGANVIVVAAPAIRGIVFEDLNYGGGNGRNRATALAAGGTGRSGARVELYDSAGVYLNAATTDTTGAYAFIDLSDGSYIVRVVNETVSSARSGYTSSLRAVQTFRTDATSGTAADVYDRVGGQVPALTDAGSNTVVATLATLTSPTATPQSLTSATVAGDVNNVDFGFSFNGIVNTNNSGQGSLRQLITNANALSNTGLAIDGRTAGIDHAIFMLADGTARAGLTASYASMFTGGVATMAPASSLPTLSGALVIDAQTQPGWLAAPIVAIDGVGAGAGTKGLVATAGPSTIRGLSIIRFNDEAIDLQGGNNHLVQGNYLGLRPDGSAAGNANDGIEVKGGSGTLIGGSAAIHRNTIGGNGGHGINVQNGGSTAVVIRGNYIGVDPTGTVARANTNGINVDQGSSHTIGGSAAGEGNLISGNSAQGIWLSRSATILGNLIGTNAAGNAAIPNAQNGISLRTAANVVIGGSSAGARNVISGNADNGIEVISGATAAQILGNFIGTTADGTAALGNGDNGVRLDDNDGIGSAINANLISGNGRDGITISPGSSGVTVTGNQIGVNAAGTAALGNARYGIELRETGTIGGTTPAERNVVSGNGDIGISLSSNASGSVIRGNYIGTNAAGTAVIANAKQGIRISDTSNNVVIGGTAAGAGNLVSGNADDGIELASSVSGAVVQGNLIGTNAAGTGAIPNSGDGVDIDGGSGHTIGGTGTGAGNVIAYNGALGVSVDGGSSHAILGNSLHSNFRLGIDLFKTGENGYAVTLNDGIKTSGQPNQLMDFPVFTSASWDGTLLRVRGYVGSASGQTLFADSRVEVFLSDNDTSGYGEGRDYVGATTTDANGNFAIALTPPAGVTVAVGAKVTGTATDTANNTSEFSANFNIREYLPFRNGSFEDGNLGAKINGGDGFFWRLADGATSIDYWVVGAGLEVMESDYWNASHGVRSADLNVGGAGGTIAQTFDTEPGMTYSVFFDHTGSAACGPTRKSLRVSAAGVSTNVTDYRVGGSAVIPPSTPAVYGVYYNTALFRFTAVNDLTTLQFESLNGSVCGPILDNVRVAVADPFVNGSFESASTNPGSGWASLAGGSSAIDAWTVTGDSIDYGGSGTHTPTEGSRQVELNGNAPGGVSQTFDALPESWLRARFDYFNNSSGPPVGTIDAIGDGTGASFSAPQSAGTAYSTREFVYRVTSTQSSLAFVSSTPGGGGPILDYVRIEDALPFINGSFEDARFPLRDSTDLGVDNILVRGWVTMGGALQHWGTPTFAPSLGSYSLHLNGPAGAGTMAQTFDVSAGQSYDVLFDAAANPALAADQSLRATIVDGGTTISTRNVTLNPASVLAGQTRWRTQQISFTATSSRVTLTFESQTAGTRGLVLDNVRFGVLGTLNTTGQFNAFEPATAANAITGVIKTKLVGTPFTLDIAAIKLDKTGYSSYPMSGIKVELVDGTDNAAPLDDITNCRASWISVATITAGFALAGTDNGRKPLSFTVGNAYRNLRVKVSYPGSGTATVIGCSNDNFAVRPVSFTGFAATDNDDSTAGTARVLNNAGSGGVVHRAGRPFTVIARAVDDGNNTVTGYDGAPQLAIASCLVPTGCTAGTLAGSATTTAGTVTGNTFTYSEAGSIGVQLEDAMFADADAGDSTQDERAIRLAAPATIGRFVPDRYQLTTATAPSMGHASCGAGPGTQTFTFVGQSFGFATAPVVRATALNAAGVAIVNARPSFGATHVSSAIAAAGAPVAFNGSANVAGIVAAGDALISFGAGTFSFTRDAAVPIATFAPTFNLTVSVSDTSEAGATSAIVSQAPLAITGIGFAGGTGNSLHYGRLILRPAYADLRSDLYLPLEVQRYTALGWQALADAGACVSAAASAFAYSQATGLLNGGAGASNCTSRVLNDVTTAGGRASIRLPKPAGGAVPSAMTVTLNTGAAAGTSCNGAGTAIAATSASLPWLAGAAGAAPAARVSWGAPRSDYLMLREKFD